MIKKTLKKGTIQDQDAFRRTSLARLSPAERIEMLTRARDIAFPYASMKKVVTHRKLF